MKRYRTPAERLELRRKGDANRLKSIGVLVADSIRHGMAVADVIESTTTSGAPKIHIVTKDGLVFHATITKARK